MSGHSKWATTKRKKAVIDGKKSKAFTKVVKEIAVAVKEGGGTDPEGNARLRLAIANAKGVNMPKENIERAINKAADKNAANLMETTYEGYGPNGIAIFLECTTDNINRTVSNVRTAFTKYGGALGTKGSLEFIFVKKGVFTVAAGIPIAIGVDEEEFTLELIDGGAEEVEKEDEVFIIYTSFEDFGRMQKKLDQMGITPENAQLQRIPITTKTLGLEASKKIFKLIEHFEEDEDVQNVYHNLEMTDELVKEL